MRNAGRTLWLALGVLGASITSAVHGRITFGHLTCVTGLRLRLAVSGKLKEGHRLRVMAWSFPVSLSVGPTGSLDMGNDVFLNQGVRIHAEDSVVIGNRVEIWDLVSIMDTNFHAIEPGSDIEIAPVVVGDECWIYSGATLLPGVHLGSGTVVAAGAVVTKSSPARSVVGGTLPVYCESLRSLRTSAAAAQTKPRL